MAVAQALYKLGFPEENRAFVDSLASIENRLRHPASRMDDDSSSDEELTGDEGGGWSLVPREVLKERRKAQEQQEKEQQRRLEQPKPASAKQGGTGEARTHAEGEPMEGEEEQQPVQPKSTMKKVTAVVGAALATTSAVVISRPAPARRVSPMPVAASTSRAKSSTTRTLHVPKPPRFPSELVEAGPVASGSGLGRASAAPKRASASEQSDSDIEIIEDVSPPPKKKVVEAPSPPAPPVKTSSKKRSSEASTSTSKARSSPKKKKSKLKPLKDLVAADKKLGAKKIQDRWKTISRYIDRLEGLMEEAEPVQDTFAGCRVLVVHPDLRAGKSEHNKIDAYLVGRLGNLAGAGATLVKPEDFLAPPFGSKPTTGPWTTHIMLPIIPGTKTPSFSAVLESLGPHGIGLEDLGDFVQVVREEWFNAFSLQKQLKRPVPDESDYYLQDDPRLKRASPVKRSPAKKSDRGRRKSGDSDTDDEREEKPMQIDEDHSMDLAEQHRVPVSPFGSDDYPTGEKPPHGYRPLDISADTTASDPIVDPTPTAPKTIQGLEKEMAYLLEHGLEKVDAEMDAIDDELDRLALEANPNAYLIPKNTVEYKSDRKYKSLEAVDIEESDYETEEEEEAENRGRKGKSKGEALPDGYGKYKRGKKDRWFKKGAGYACDRGSTGGHGVGPNDAVAKKLDELSEEAHQDLWRSRGYKMAAQALRNCPQQIKTFKQAKALDKIGDSTATKIVEIVQTGTHRRLENRSQRVKTIEQFSHCYGIGKAVSAQLWDKGARSLEDLTDQADYYELNAAQKLGLKYYDDLLKRIPRDEVAQIHQIAIRIAEKIDPKLEVRCTGSYARGADTCGDIDFLVTRTTDDGRDHRGLIKKLWNGLVQAGIVRHCLTSSDDWNALDAKFNALCALPNGLMRRLDILGVPRDEFPAAIAYFSSGEYFNRSMRLKAHKFGYRLNQRGLYKNVSRGKDNKKLTEGVKIPLKTEEELFEALDVPWRPYTERNI